MMQCIYSGVAESLSIWGKDSVHVYECITERKASFLRGGGRRKKACSSSPVLTSLSCWTLSDCSGKTNKASSSCWIYPAQVCTSSLVSDFTNFWSVPSLWKTLIPLIWHYHFMRRGNQLHKLSFTCLYLLVFCIIHILLAKSLLTLILVTKVERKLWLCHEVFVYAQSWLGSLPFASAARSILPSFEAI